MWVGGRPPTPLVSRRRLHDLHHDLQLRLWLSAFPLLAPQVQCRLLLVLLVLRWLSPLMLAVVAPLLSVV